MADEIKPGATPGETVQPVTPSQTPVAEPKIVPSVQPSASQSAASIQPSASKELRVVGDDDSEPEGDERFAISPKAFKSRLERAQRKVLKDLLGTDDTNEAKRLVDKYRSLEKEADTRRLSEMTELQREKELRKRREKEFDAFKKDVRSREVKAAVNEVETFVTGIVKDLVREKASKHAIRDFQEFVGGLSEQEADAFYNEKDIRDWFENYAKEYEVGKVRQPVDQPMQVGMGAATEKKVAQQPTGDKMNLSSKGGASKKEVNEYLKKKGLSVRL
jgi:hypothetical protein